MTYQTLVLDTISGPKEIKAPGGDFDRTATKAWARLLALTSEMYGRRPPKWTRLREHRLDGQIEVLCILLGNSLGMAAPYWRDEAKKLVEAGETGS